ncbi:MAG: BamA/TamA family outer membrane protein, partial [Arenimonas sp.]|nr:BamA/TamA family outer membrane protein [Arenimonas sp.]
ARGPRDMLLRPRCGSEVSTTDFSKAAESLAIGATAALQASPRLAELSRPEADYQRQLTAQTQRDMSPPVIDFIRLENKTAYSDELLLARLDAPLGQPLDVTRLEDSILRIYGLQTLDRLTYALVEEEGRTGLVVDAKPHSHGPNYLETGLNFYSSFSGDFLANLRVGVLRSPSNSLGGEARLLAQIGSEPGLLAELYQPLDVEGRYFVGGRASYSNSRLSQFDSSGNQLASYSVPIFGGDVFAGREFGNFGAAVIAWRRAYGNTEVATGDPSLPEEDFQIGEMRWSLTLDRLDSASLPRDGSYVSLGGLYSREGLGADSNFDQINLDATYARLFGVHSGFIGLRYHETTNGEAPFQSQFRLGSVTRFAGYRPNELVTPNYALVYGGYTLELGSVLSRPAILGGTLEYGQVWQNGSGPADRRDEVHASIYAGFDSWLGRLLFGYGYREGGEGTFFLELGQQR